MSSDIRKSPVDILNAAFSPKKDGERSTSQGYDHPHSDVIITGAKRILSYTATGQELLNFAEEHNVKIKVLKDNKQSGYIPSSDLAIITCPANQTKVTPATVLNFIQAVREAEQELSGFGRPSPTLPKEEYIAQDMKKQEDILVTQFYCSYELHKNRGIEDLLIELKKDGKEQFVNDFVNHMLTNDS